MQLSLLTKMHESEHETVPIEVEAENVVPVKTEDFAEFTQGKRNVFLSLQAEITEVNSNQQIFHVNGWLNFFWILSELPIALKDRNLEEMDWAIPGLRKSDLPVNEENVFDNGTNHQLLSTPSFSYNSETSLVQWALHVSVDLAISFEMTPFPFDRQNLCARLNTRKAFWNYLAVAPSLVPDYHMWRVPFRYRLSPAVSGWLPATPFIKYSNNKSCDFTARVQRTSRYYLLTICLPYYVIVGACITTFSPTIGVGERLTIDMTLLLTMVAFKSFMVRARSVVKDKPTVAM